MTSVLMGSGDPETKGLSSGFGSKKIGPTMVDDGGFDLGAATFVNLVPAEQLGIVVLTSGRPMGIAEALGTIFSDIALYGKPTQDWFPLQVPQPI